MRTAASYSRGADFGKGQVDAGCDGRRKPLPRRASGLKTVVETPRRLALDLVVVDSWQLKRRPTRNRGGRDGTLRSPVDLRRPRAVPAPARPGAGSYNQPS
jgi:hypothetical protein